MLKEWKNTCAIPGKSSKLQDILYIPIKIYLYINSTLKKEKGEILHIILHYVHFKKEKRKNIDQDFRDIDAVFI